MLNIVLFKRFVKAQLNFLLDYWYYLFEMERDLLSQANLQEYLQISRTTLYKLIRKNEIPHMRLGRKFLFRKKDVDAWLESKRVK